MGKFTQDKQTQERMRAARNRVPAVPEDKLPRGYDQETFAKAVAAAEGRVGPAKFDAPVTIVKTEIEWAEEDANGYTDEYDLWKIHFKFAENDPDNPGYLHVEYWRTDRSEDPNENLNRMTMEKVDAVVTAAGVDYEIAENGEYDYDETFLKNLNNVEVIGRMTVGTRYDKKNKLWRKDVEFYEFAEVE